MLKCPLDFHLGFGYRYWPLGEIFSSLLLSDLQTLQAVLLARHLLRPRDDPLSHHLQIHRGGYELNSQSRTSVAGSDLPSKATKQPQHSGHLSRLRRPAGGQLHICCFVGSIFRGIEFLRSTRCSGQYLF